MLKREWTTIFVLLTKNLYLAIKLRYLMWRRGYPKPWTSPIKTLIQLSMEMQLKKMVDEMSNMLAKNYQMTCKDPTCNGSLKIENECIFNAEVGYPIAHIKGLRCLVCGKLFEKGE